MAEPARRKSAGELRELYVDLAPQLDRMAWLNRLVTGRQRRRLFGKARGRTLDVACGLGLNLRFLPETVDYAGVDLSPEMLTRARARFTERDPTPAFLRMDASSLAFEDDAFDTVISSLSTCTFPDPDAVLREMSRVCGPDGRILLLEHGRSSVEWLARFQDWRAEAHFEKHGCRWAQDPLDLVTGAGLPVRRHRTSLLGILTAIEARPG